MKYQIKLGLTAVVFACFCLTACDGDDEIPDDNIPEATKQKNVEVKHSEEALSWTVEKEDFVEEMLALQKIYEHTGWEGTQLVVKTDPLKKVYFFTVYPNGCGG